MDPVLTFVLAGLVIFAAHVVAGLTGFGTAILGLPLLALLFDLDVGKQSLAILSTLAYAYIALRWRGHIAWRELGLIVALAGVGVPIGMWLYGMLPRRGSMIILGAFIAIVGLRKLLKLWPEQRSPRWLARLLLVAGGVVHGALTTGGPLIVVYVTQAIRHKSSFRVTLCVMWLMLNAILAIGWTAMGAWSPRSFQLSLIGLPFTLAGLILGERLHRLASEATFATIVDLTLLLMGVLLIVSAAS